MAKVTIGIGAALILLGVILYLMSEPKAPTSLIPAYFGLPLVICGAVALKPEYRKHAMHAAAVIGVLGFIMPLGRLIPVMIQGRTPAPAALVGLLTMCVLCGVLVVLCVRSFIQARRDRQSAAAPAP